MFNTRGGGIFSALFQDKRGNFSIMAAVVIPLGLAAAGIAMDASNLMAEKAKLQAAADSAAVAAGAALVNDGATIDQAKALALDFVKGQMSSELQTIADDQAAALAKGTDSPFGTFNISDCTNVDIQEATGYGTSKIYNVTVTTCLDVKLFALGSYFGSPTETLNVTSGVQSDTASKKALSMYLVLDRSGSMGDNTSTAIGTETYYYYCGWGRVCEGTRTKYLTKIDALKQAASNLLTQISTADPDALYSRLGAVSYNSYMQTPENLNWGTSGVASYVNALTATGGTDSSDAFKEAYQKLSADTENAVHQQKNGQTPDKYIIFMTDGENNYSSADTATKSWCNAAKNAGIEVYSIAFMAPDAGKALLNYCATDASHYFAAEDADQMIAAFKYIGDKATNATTRLTQ